MNDPQTFVRLTIDKQVYEVDLALVTGEQVIEIRNDLGIEVGPLLATLAASEAELPELVALMVLSLRQADEPADHRWLARHIALGADVVVEMPGLEAALTSEPA